MRKPVHIWLAVLLITLVGVIAWQVLLSQEREPVYQGKRLSSWLREYESVPISEPLRAEPAVRAVKQIGTNGIPTLLKMLRKKDFAFTSKLIDLWDRHISGTGWLPFWVRSPEWYWNNATVQNLRAISGFEILGADAQQAVPALINIYEQNKTEPSHSEAGWALIAVGPAAHPAILSLLLRRAAVSKEPIRETTVTAGLLPSFSPGRLFEPVLKGALSNVDSEIRMVAARGLGDIGFDARDAVQGLVLLLSDPSETVRQAATNALKAIGPEAAAKAGWRVLVELLSDTNSWIRFQGASGLGDFGAEARDTVPALVRLLGDPEWIVRQAATNAFKAIDPDAAAKAGVK